MKSKQLANVLIKVLGLSELVWCLAGLAAGLLQMNQAPAGFPGGVFRSFWASTLITFFIGIILIFKSRAIAELLFRAEDEEPPQT